MTIRLNYMLAAIAALLALAGTPSLAQSPAPPAHASKPSPPPDTAFGQRFSKDHHQSVLKSDYAHRYRYYHGKWMAKAPTPKPVTHKASYTDSAYAQRYGQDHHQSVLKSDYAHRYRYYHGKWPTTKK